MMDSVAQIGGGVAIIAPNLYANWVVQKELRRRGERIPLLFIFPYIVWMDSSLPVEVYYRHFFTSMLGFATFAAYWYLVGLI